MTGSGTRARPPTVVLGWAGVLVLTVAIGVVGQTGIGPSAGSGRGTSDPSVAASVPAAGSTVPAAKRPSTRPLSRPTRTRPPIGEDGVMGGLVFGTAFGWLEPAPAGRRALE